MSNTLKSILNKEYVTAKDIEYIKTSNEVKEIYFNGAYTSSFQYDVELLDGSYWSIQRKWN